MKKCISLFIFIAVLSINANAEAITLRTLKSREGKIFTSGKVHLRLQKIFQKKDETEKTPLIIRFKETPKEEDLNIIRQKGTIKKQFQRFFKGTSISLSKKDLEELVERDIIEAIYDDFEVSALLDNSTKEIYTQEAKENFQVDGKNIKVAVLDTGIASNHTALRGKVIASKDFSGDGTTEDLNGHGTHVACIIACNDEIYEGVAPGASIINAKVIPKEGVGDASGILEALEWVSEQGAQVINMSFGAETESCDGTDVLSTVIDEVVQSGITVVVAAGNSGPVAESINIPACSQKSIAVGASDGDDIASFSSYGPTADGRQKPDIIAPGVNITAANFQGGWITYSGTSMAAPHITGTVALMLDVQESLTPEEIQQKLYEAAEELQKVNILETLKKVAAENGAVLEDDTEEIVEEEIKDETEPQEELEQRIEQGKGILKTCQDIAKFNFKKKKECIRDFFAHIRLIQREQLSESEQQAQEGLEENAAGVTETLEEKEELNEEVIEKFESIVETIEGYNFVEDSATVVEKAIEEVKALIEAGETEPLENALKNVREIIEKEMEESRKAKFERGIIPFKDTDDSDWYFSYVAEMAGKGWISGYFDSKGKSLGEFRPQNNLTVAEALKIALRSFSKSGVTENKIPKVSLAKGHWAEGYFLAGENLGVSLALNSNTIPDREITRAEFVKLVLQVYGVTAEKREKSIFMDVDSTFVPELDYIEKAVELGIIEGYEDGTFRPFDPINRAEAAKVIIQTSSSREILS